MEALMTDVNEICRSNGAWGEIDCYNRCGNALLSERPQIPRSSHGPHLSNYIVQDGRDSRTALPQVHGESSA